MKQNDIRPHEFDNMKEDALNKDLTFLHQNLNKFVAVNCPACDKNNKTFIFEKYKFKFYKCDHCRTVYMYKRPSKDLLVEFYKNSTLYNFWNEYIFPKSEQIRKRKIFEPRIETILHTCKEHNIEMKNFLEIGAGYGYLCEILIEKDIYENVIAIEPNKELYTTCKKKKINTINKNFEDVKFKCKFDTIVSFETIEHMFDPFKVLNQINQIMNTKGLLFLTCPNFEGFDVITLLEKSDNIDAEHINMFNPDSIKILLERAGFNIISIDTPGQLDVDIVKEKLLNKEITNLFLEKLLLTQSQEGIDNFQKYLRENNLSSHMQILAIKG